MSSTSDASRPAMRMPARSSAVFSVIAMARDYPTGTGMPCCGGLEYPPPRCGQHVGRQPLQRTAGVQQQPGACLLAVLRAEAAQMCGVTHAWTRCCLHFHGQQAIVGLDHEVHLLAGGGAPVAELRAREPCVAPRE